MIHIKKESSTNPRYGCPPEERATEDLLKLGIINIDKPSGPTSHQISDYVKKITHLKKAGHSGSLDPRVTGVLPVALDRATRITQVLLKGDKGYIGIMHLHKDLPEEKLKKSFQKFTGEIEQLPPVKSAVKRRKRIRRVYSFNLLEKENKDILFKVKCQAGTYIRKLCLHPKTEILSKKGFIPISDFYSNPQTVYSSTDHKVIKKNPSAVQKINSPKELIKITMTSGISITVTPDHKLLKSTEEGYKMCEADKLKKEDYLVKSLKLPSTDKELIIADLLDDDYLIPQKDIKDKCKKALILKYGSIRAMHREVGLDRKSFLKNNQYAITIHHLKLAGIYEKVKKDINTFKTQKGTIVKMESLNQEFFYLLGLIASDGNNTKEKNTARYTRIKFHNNNKKLINQFLSIYKKIFPQFPISKKEIRTNFFQLDSTNSFLATIAASLGIKSPRKKSDLLPILNVHCRLIKPFLKGYFDGNGSVYYKKHQNKCHSKICLHTINLLDANRLHKMLLKIGIPNKIYKRKKTLEGREYIMYEVAIARITAEKKFIKEIGTNHPKKLRKFKDILSFKNKSEVGDRHHIGFHFKEEIKKNKKKLYKMGGNLNRVLTKKIPITRRFYKKASDIITLPPIDDFIIEKINSIKHVKGTRFVYDMTIPKAHNFLIETGFISSNCHDLGEHLKTGAHMAELRRIQVANFDESTLHTLQDLKDAYFFWKEENNDKFLRHCLQPIENAVQHLPKIWVSDPTIESLCHGNNLFIPGISKLEDFEKNQLIAILSLKNELVCLGKTKMSSEEIMKKEKGTAASIDKVFMEPGTYPK